MANVTMLKEIDKITKEQGKISTTGDILSKSLHLHIRTVEETLNSLRIDLNIIKLKHGQYKLTQKGYCILQFLNNQ